MIGITIALLTGVFFAGCIIAGFKLGCRLVK
jgi:threonine/homoserine efflux transporter RhtA